MNKANVFIPLAICAMSNHAFASEFDRQINFAAAKFGCSKGTPCDVKVTKDDKVVSVKLTKAHIDKKGLLLFAPGDHNTYQFTLEGKFIAVLKGE